MTRSRQEIEAEIAQTYVDQTGVERALSEAAAALDELQTRRVHLWIELDEVEENLTGGPDGLHCQQATSSDNARQQGNQDPGRE